MIFREIEHFDEFFFSNEECVYYSIRNRFAMSSEPGEAAPTAGKIARCPWCDCRIIDTAAAEKVDKEV
jgi:hypothetical protein